MKFHFKNIGPISKAELELGDLTIIAGGNNTGKTYLVYTLYGFLKGRGNWSGFGPYHYHLLERTIDKHKKDFSASGITVEKIAHGLSKEGSYKCEITSGDLSQLRCKIISEFAGMFSEIGIADIFSSPRSNFENASIEVEFDSDFLNKSIESKYFGEASILVEYDGENLLFSIEKFGTRRLHESIIDELIPLGYVNFLLGDLPSAFILSAERFGISLFYKELDFTKNRLVEMLQKKGDENERFSPFMFLHKNASRYALPIKDNIDYTRSISDFVNRKGELEAEKLDDSIKNIMGGYYKSDENDIRFISKWRKNRHFNIPLHLASSSARGLSDLYFYLRHKAEKNHLLIIDEPESHLDTKNQIALARMLSQFVRSGIKVLITTHSDYLLKEINNLIMLSSSFKNKDNIVKELGYKKDDFLPPDSLRCYVAEKGQLTPCKVDKFGAELPIFENTIDTINRTSNRLASQLEDAEER